MNLSGSLLNAHFAVEMLYLYFSKDYYILCTFIPKILFRQLPCLSFFTVAFFWLVI
jgi:hypothetical protein